MNRRHLLAWVFRLGFPLGILLALGAAVLLPRAAPAQYPLEASPSRSGSELVPVPGATPRAARMRGRVPCDEIVSTVDHQARSDKGLAANVAVIAKRLGTTQLWVGHCLLAYGRRVPASLANVGNEDVLERLESDEPEESAAEDVTEPGTQERDPTADENSRDRQELRAGNPNKTGQEKERVLRLRPPPAETGHEGFGEGLNEGY